MARVRCSKCTCIWFRISSNSVIQGKTAEKSSASRRDKEPGDSSKGFYILVVVRKLFLWMIRIYFPQATIDGL